MREAVVVVVLLVIVVALNIHVGMPHKHHNNTSQTEQHRGCYMSKVLNVLSVFSACTVSLNFFFPFALFF